MSYPPSSYPQPMPSYAAPFTGYPVPRPAPPSPPVECSEPPRPWVNGAAEPTPLKDVRHGLHRIGRRVLHGKEVEPAAPGDAAACLEEEPCVRPKRAWIAGAYMPAFLKPAPLIPLVTTGSTSNATPGALGQPNTAVLFGSRDLNYGLANGVSLSTGFWLDDDCRYSIDAQGFYLFIPTQQFMATSNANGAPLIVRPFFDAIRGQEGAFATADPGRFTGNTAVDAAAQLYGAELNGRHLHCFGKCCYVEPLVGFRFLRLDEELKITDQLQPLTDNVLTFLGNVVNPPATISDFDRFYTANTFLGIQVGGRLGWKRDNFSVDLLGKLAMGTNYQFVKIQGATTLNSPTGSTTAQGGILAQPTNIGDYNQFVFSVVPEFGFNLGYCLFPNLRLSVGYSVLLWTNVVRPGDQIDRVINTSQVPTDQGFGAPGGPGRPAFDFVSQLFWLHSFRIEIEYRF
jgi:Putative beta barrel porin-7 (BBP7)